MNLWKKVTVAAGMMAAVGLTGMTAMAANTNQTPAEVVADLAGRTVQEVVEERNSGLSYGKIADAAGVLEEFKKEMYDSKAAWYKQQVEAGRMTEQAAQDALAVMAERHADCDEAKACAWSDGTCVWSDSNGTCVMGHESGVCAWTDEDGNCIWGHNSGNCTWTDENGNCLSGHNNGGCGLVSGNGSCIGGHVHGECTWISGSETGNNAVGTANGTVGAGSTATTGSGHHGRGRASRSNSQNSSTQNNRGHRSGGHHGR